MTILITGTSGFVGPILAQEVKRKFPESRVFGTCTYYRNDLTNETYFNSCVMDLLDKERIAQVISEVKPDCIFHLAAQSSVKYSWENPLKTFNINVDGTINLLEIVKNNLPSTRLVIVGSSEQYGNKSSGYYSEEDYCFPSNPYGLSKMTQENLGQLYVHAYNLDIVFTRSFNHTGVGQSETFVLSDWCKQIAEIEYGIRSPKIYVGNIDLKRDFSDVRDVCRSYIALMEKGQSGEVYNIGSGSCLLLRDLLEILIDFSTIPIEIVLDEEKYRPAEQKQVVSNCSKINKIRNFKLTPIKQTLKELLDYWRKIIK